MSSGDEASLDPSRSPPSLLHSFQFQPEVLRIAGTESVLVVVPSFVPAKPARHDTMHPDDPVRDGNHRDGSLSRDRKGYRFVLLLEICISFDLHTAHCIAKIKHRTITLYK